MKTSPRPLMGPLARAVAFCVLALGVETLGPSCSSGVALPPIRAFNRPISVAFACFDTEHNVMPTAQCAVTGGVLPTGLSMHALVPQETRGEVAAVDLIARTVLDSDRRIPGYTFVPVGALPGTIIVPPLNPTCTYVANRGTNDISIIDTRRFRAARDDAFDPIELDGSPTDMVLTADETALWVALADEGVVIRLPIESACVVGAPDLVIDLGDGSALPAGVMVSPSRACTGADASTCDLSLTCALGSDPVAASPVAPRDPPVDPDTLAAPASLAIDAESGVLLVGDRNLPVIHRVVLATGDVLSPIATGAPVRDVVITPRVPDSYDPASTAPFSRYVYAIDDQDGTVMAIEYSDEASASFGGVIPVDVAGSRRPDRIRLDVVATALEVITPSYDEASADPRTALCDYQVAPTSTPGPTFLRGVFLSIAAADGSVRFVDVYDLDARCRGRAYGTAESMECTSPTIPSDVAVYIRRHRPRTSGFTLNFGGVAQPVTVMLGAATVPLLSSGMGGELVPSLEAVVCPPHLKPVLQDGAMAPSTLFCGLNDPFAVIAETWSAAWEGTIPGTATGSGNAQPVMGDTITIDSSVDYCTRGVIGAVDATNGSLPAEAPENGYPGDLLAITGLLPTAQIERAICRAVVAVSVIGEPQQPVLVPIRQAFSHPDDLSEPYRGRLVVDADAPILNRLPFSDGTVTRAVTIQDALDCYGDQALTIDVRSHQAFTVVGGRSGFSSRVVRDDADGHCAWDATLDPLAQGHAFLGRQFTNARVSFRLDPPTMGLTGNPNLLVTITSPQAPLGIDLTGSSSGVRQISLPTYLTWNEALGRLYGVDTERKGLVEMTVLPLGLSPTRFE